MPGTIADNRDTRVPYQRRLIEALETISGVDVVGFANQLPLDGCCLSTTIYAEGRPADLSASQRTSLMAVSPGYVPAMRIPLRRGRLLTDRDLADDRIFVMLNEAAARGTGAATIRSTRSGDSTIPRARAFKSWAWWTT